MTQKHKYQKLELTWIGKGDGPRLEPRILVENPEYSYGDPESGNMLIHGDNLLALKALEQDYSAKIKCIAIDPPYNTGAAFEHYDDNLEHSIWLNLMYQRIKILHSLLHNEGSMWIVIDDKELHYLKVVCDEIFGRDNFISTIAVKSSTPSGVKTVHKDKTIIKQKDYLLLYRKSQNFKLKPQYVRKTEWDTHFNYFLNADKTTLKPLVEELKDQKVLTDKQTIRDFDIDNEAHRQFYLENAEFICQTQSHRNEELKQKSRNLPDQVFHHDGIMFYNGRQLTPLSNSLNEVVYKGKTENDFALLLCDFWNDIDFQNTQNEGGVSFPNSKKPEALIFRILKMATYENDIVLDSFLGSGTTAAVAHKMDRKWIGIELGQHAISHCYPRLKGVIEGNDTSGVTATTNWQGGGGFKFYTLAPSLLNQDKYGNWIISSQYDAQRLAAAMAKQEGFRYSPHESLFWKQGISSEQDFIFTTTQFVTVESLDLIHDDMQPGESLLICCKSYQKGCKDKYKNISIKKIPQMLLGRCEFGRDDYSLNIVNMPVYDNITSEPDLTDQPSETQGKSSKKKGKRSVQEINKDNQQLSLFD